MKQAVLEKDGQGNPASIVLFHMGAGFEKIISAIVPGMDVGDARLQLVLGRRLQEAVFWQLKGQHAPSNGNGLPPEVVNDRAFILFCQVAAGKLTKINLPMLLAKELTKI